MAFLSPSVNIFEYEYRDLNATSDILTVFGVPSQPYVPVTPVYISTELQKPKFVPDEYNCNNVHYEICKESGADVGLAFEYDNTKRKVIPFSTFSNMLYNATFDENKTICFIKSIKRFSNGNIIGEYKPQYEDYKDFVRVVRLDQTDLSGTILKYWTFEYIDEEPEFKVIIEQRSNTGVLQNKIITTNFNGTEYYPFQARATFYDVSNNETDNWEYSFKYGKEIVFQGFDKDAIPYMRFSLDADNRPKVISYQYEWNTIVKCNVFYYAETPFLLKAANYDLNNVCSDYYGVEKYSRKITLDTVEETSNAFTDFEDYGLEYMSFDRTHRKITEIRYYNEIGINYKKAHPKYRPDNYIDTLIITKLNDSGTEFIYDSVINYYYDLNKKLYKVLKFNADENLVLQYNVVRTNFKISKFTNVTNPGFDIHLEYKPSTGKFKTAWHFIDLSEPPLLWFKVCSDQTNVNAVFFEDTMTTEVRYLRGNCLPMIEGSSDIDEPVATESIFIDENNSFDFIYNYEKPKVHRFFMNSGDWNFADGTGCQPYLEYIIMRKDGVEYFIVPYYKDNGIPYYVDVYEKLSEVYVGKFVQRIEFLDTLGRLATGVELVTDYDLMVAKPYVALSGNYYNSENSHAMKMADADGAYHIPGYFLDEDAYTIPALGYQKPYPIFEPCPEDLCDEMYWVDDYSSDLEYVVMCWFIDPCEQYVIDDYLDPYVDMCAQAISCSELYFDPDVIDPDLVYVDACLVDTNTECVNPYTNPEYALEQDLYIQCPEVV